MEQMNANETLVIEIVYERPSKLELEKREIRMKYGVLPNILPSRPGQSPLLTAVEADDFLLASILRAGNELYGNIRISREDKQCAARVWAERYPKDAELAIQHEWMGAAHAIAWMLGV